MPLPTVLSLAAAALLLASRAAGAAQIAIQSVEISKGSAGPSIAIVANGPLPAPTGGVLDAPSRIYLDFAGVTTAIKGGPQSDDLVARIRIAVHSDAPLTTRVVFDLKAPATYTIGSAQSAAGRVEIQLRAGSPPRQQPATTPAAAPRAPAGASVAQRLRGALDALDALRPTLESVDRGTAPAAGAFTAAASELQRIKAQLSSIKPDASMAETHSILQSATVMATRAVTMAGRGEAAGPEAASAAAGALILLNKARAQLRP